MLCLVLALPAFAQSPSPANTTDSLAAELPRIPPRSPEEAKASFQLASGFAIDLVASEPLVVDPVAFSFDSRGRLFVVEMIDYSEQEQEALGRIALLSDQDGDGQMDQRSSFVERLSWPTAVHAWKDGVIVLAPPYLNWYRDTDGDGQHDRVESWCQGFGRSNVQGMANSLRWSIEGYLVGATSSSGAELEGPFIDHGPLVLRGRDFRIDPLAKAIVGISGGGQHGMAMNRWGDRFVTSNSDHLQQIIDIDGWLSAHTTGSLPLKTRRSIAEDGPQAEVYRASPVEPWRIVRTRLRVSGEVPGAVEGGGRAAGYFTGATGTCLMDAEANFGLPGFDTAIVCDVGSNLIHRKKLEREGLFWKATRIDQETELVRSTDIWFRPVQLGDGPDGSLYIADMYREVIEHPKSLPPMIKQHLDLTSGNDRGRIWRLRPTTALPGTVAARDPLSALAELSNQQLVGKLSSPIAWQRRMASQLLIERQAMDVMTELQGLVGDQAKPEVRILALHLLARLGQLDPATHQRSLGDRDPRVQRHAIALLAADAKRSAWLAEPATIRRLVEASDAATQLELAMASSTLETSARLDLLRVLASQVADPLLQSIIVAAAGPESWRLLAGNTDSDSPSMDEKTEAAWRRLLVGYWGQLLQATPKTKSAAAAGQAQPSTSSPAAFDTQELRTRIGDWIHRDLSRGPDRLEAWTEALLSLPSPSQADKFLDCWQPEDRNAWQQFIQRGLATAQAATEQQSRWVPRLRFTDEATQAVWLEQHVSPRETEEKQRQVIEACMWSRGQATAAWLLPRLSQCSPNIQQYCLQQMLGQVTTSSALATALEEQRLSLNLLLPSTRQSMQRHPNSQLRQRFNQLLAASQPTSAEIQLLIEAYTPLAEAQPATADPSVLGRGQVTFEKVCAACHRLGNLGNDVGPPLRSLHEKSPAQLLTSILDPNREIDPRYQAWTILLGDGRAMSGVIREEASSYLVMAEANGKLSTIPREDIQEMKATGQSLMPMGIHQQIAPEPMAELIAWLRQQTR
jgi:putative membrane-bound dehydrogenase-like protein